MTEKKKKIKLEWKRGLLVLAMIVVGIVMVLVISRSVNYNMENSQLKTLDVVAERITENMQNYFNRQWDRLYFIERNLQEQFYLTNRELLDYLGVEKEAVGFADTENIMLLVDDEGFYYSVDRGKIAQWHTASTVFSPLMLQKNQEVSINSLSEMHENKLSEYLCFALKLEKEVVTGNGTHFTHLILAADKEVFNINLSLSSFGTITDTFVMDSKGRKINAQMLTTELARSYNIMAALKQAEFLMGNTYEEFFEAFQNKTSASSLIRSQGEEYYITSKYMGEEDWFSIFLVADEDMISDVKRIAYQLISQLGLGFALMVIIASILLVLNSRESRLKEREVQRKLTEAAEIADKANKAKSVFLSRMSHDIRTPINGIIGMTNIAQSTIDDQESVKNCLRKISSSSEHLYELVNEVLEITRIESGKTELHAAPMNLLTMLDKLGDIIESKQLDKSLVYETDFTQLSHPHVIADENIIKQVLLNLLGNSVKYTPDGGRMRCIVSDEVSGEGLAYYHFVVEDTGIGMKKEFIDHIFERFSQEAISARTNYEGTGLGMAITKEFVDLMDGTISVASEEGNGSRFEVILPLQYYVPEKEAVETAVAQKKARPYHVLVAEDNEINRTIVEFILTENGSTCELVGNGKELTERFRQAQPGEFDAIMTDIRMPVMDGLEAAKTIRAMEREDAKTIPIFAMTANAYRKDREASLEAGMNAHLTKPLEADEIMAALKEFCI